MNDRKILDLLAEGVDLEMDFNIHIFDTLGSTNNKLSQLIAEENAPPGTIIIAKMQTDGRGQRGKKWDSDTGGLYLSLAISPDLLARNIHQLTLGIVWGIAHQLRQKGLPVSIKWPNDLILADRKLGGILTQTRISQGRIQHAIVGVGINYTNTVEGLAINLAPSNDYQPNYRNFSIEMLTSCTIRGIISGYKRCTPATIDSLLLDYLELLNARGRSVLVNGQLGTVLGISPQGELHIGFTTATEITETYLTPGTFTLGYESL
ncbi:biotin--[acetyl-CoA-carboxylase] ligase [Chamaesiphon sp. VAR_48_metabat_135_sub]|uniref:biotin--[acetyl-CoA-carboxylase] ligase n=1 Tax=Chamaesiphon sp. VAR_48_metabat_135_sub TaxID=2964699 RepID=UPI00286CADF4|nr:biotin--[acetyl-CoA-carboxylase] ligase [Chamaesiphon sp. VAR_48_metabat_135_sub]